MALQLDMEIGNTGVIANYLKVTSVQRRISDLAEDNKFIVSVAMYKDEAARLAGKRPIHSLSLEAVDTFNMQAGPFMENIYRLIKLLPKLSGAIDV